MNANLKCVTCFPFLCFWGFLIDKPKISNYNILLNSNHIIRILNLEKRRKERERKENKTDNSVHINAFSNSIRFFSFQMRYISKFWTISLISLKRNSNVSQSKSLLIRKKLSLVTFTGHQILLQISLNLNF